MRRIHTSITGLSVAAAAMLAAVGCSSDDTSGTSATTTPDGGRKELDARQPVSERRSPMPDTFVPPDVRSTESGPPDGASDAPVKNDGAPPVFPVGRRCAKDADCAAGLTCLKTTDHVNASGGGPAGGYCTKECTPESGDAGALTAAQAICTAISPATLCIQLDPSSRKSFCFESCLTGNLFPGVAKCGGRADVGCAPTTASGVDFCAPTCGSDADCDGRHCDIGTGYCTDSPPAGAPIGTPCGAGSALEKSGGQCAGFCFSIPRPGSATPLSICSGQCVLGQNGCGTKVSSPGSVIPGPGVCALAFSYSSNFDTGYCAQACDCDADCLDPDTVCAKLPGPSVAGQRYGACLPVFFGNPLQGRACGDAGADAAPGRDAGVRDASRG